MAVAACPDSIQQCIGGLLRRQFSLEESAKKVFVGRGSNRLKHRVCGGDLLVFTVQQVIICTRNEAGRYN